MMLKLPVRDLVRLACADALVNKRVLFDDGDFVYESVVQCVRFRPNKPEDAMIRVVNWDHWIPLNKIRMIEAG